jgi:tetratricopeptide (TPR) repeat protein
MKIGKMPGPLWKAPAYRTTNTQDEAQQKGYSVEQGDLNQGNLNIMVKGKLLSGFQPMDVPSLILSDTKVSDKSKLGDRWQRLWTYDTEAGAYQNIRDLILLGRIEEAEAALAALPIKTAQWYYLNGVVLWEKGLYAEGYNSIQQAASMAPENKEYREALYYILQVYHPLLVLRFCKRVFKKVLPLIYIILIFLCIALLISYII